MNSKGVQIAYDPNAFHEGSNWLVSTQLSEIIVSRLEILIKSNLHPCPMLSCLPCTNSPYCAFLHCNQRTHCHYCHYCYSAPSDLDVNLEYANKPWTTSQSAQNYPESNRVKTKTKDWCCWTADGSPSRLQAIGSRRARAYTEFQI